MVFYRKYRSQIIEELDLSDVREKLSAILSSGEIPHALLFHGPRGTGKTSAARIVAKAINCEVNPPAGGQKLKVKSIEPCNQCEFCVSITAGSNLDILEIDAASNRGIEEIRDLREKIRLASLELKYKVYIIDEAHMLTQEAFNALLKTLEEPPAHAVFILATTEYHKLPATIVSRCLPVCFNRASAEEICRSLKRIVKGEKLKLEGDVLSAIAGASDGSFRDAAKLLEQAVAENKLTLESVGGLLSGSVPFSPDKLLKLLSEKKDPGESLRYIQKAKEKGIDFKDFTLRLAGELHAALLCRYGLVDSSRDFAGFSVDGLLSLLERLEEAYGRFAGATLPELPLEIAVIKWSRDYRGEANDQPVKENDKNRINNAAGDVWEKIMTAVKEHNPTLAGILRGCRMGKRKGAVLPVETAYEFHYNKLTQHEKELSQIVSELLKEQVEVKSVLKIQDKN